MGQRVGSGSICPPIGVFVVLGANVGDLEGLDVGRPVGCPVG